MLNVRNEQFGELRKAVPHIIDEDEYGTEVLAFTSENEESGHGYDLS